MRIEGFNPFLPSVKSKEERKPSTPSQAVRDQFISAAENAVAYNVPAANKDLYLQVKNYVVTVLFRQNWVERSSRLNAQVLRSAAGIDLQDPAYWQPEQVAKRILNFAKALGGNDPAKIEPLREAATNGIEDAAKMLGGMNATLQKTKELVNLEFETWQSELSSQ